MNVMPIRLSAGVDLRQGVERACAEAGLPSAFVVAGMGSLVDAHVRFAAQTQAATVPGPSEVLTLSGCVTPDGAHLHVSIADAAGRVVGGHVALGCRVRTTMELLVVPLPDWDLRREHDPATGYPELVVRRRRADGDDGDSGRPASAAGG